MVTTQTSPPLYTMGGGRCPVVAVCCKRLLGRQYFEPKSSGLELGDERPESVH